MAVPDEAAVGDGRPVAMKKSAWTKEEDAVLREQVRLHGPLNWAAISKALAGRNPKSCLLRWCQHLSPIVDTARPFTPQEDEKIIAFYRMFPSKWATIAGFLQGRTDNAIKNRWHSVLSKVYQQQQRAAAPIRRLPDGTLVLFPLTPGDVKAFGMDTIPVLRHPPPGVDLSGECLNLFPLVAGDLVRGNNASEAAVMDVDCSTDESLVELKLWPSTNHEGGVPGDESLAELRLWPSTNH
ncbi:transcription factor MYB1-like [Miscanthus floridulus]|uniref:transcription factor MYB1-like n=1 Tax=Miscanthus floridulus TaxID=154761 RepID=UPI003457BA42